MLKFTFKLISRKDSPERTFIGTWSEFDEKYPTALLAYTPKPIEKEEIEEMELA